MSDLRKQLIRLAHSNPELRPHLLPLLKEAGCEKLPEGGMRDNCEKKKEEGGKADGKADKTASSNPYDLYGDDDGRLTGRAIDATREFSLEIRAIDEAVSASYKRLQDLIEQYAKVGASDGESYRAINGAWARGIQKTLKKALDR